VGKPKKRGGRRVALRPKARPGGERAELDQDKFRSAASAHLLLRRKGVRHRSGAELQATPEPPGRCRIPVGAALEAPPRRSEADPETGKSGCPN
jgi:hypothetical protein